MDSVFLLLLGGRGWLYKFGGGEGEEILEEIFVKGWNLGVGFRGKKGEGVDSLGLGQFFK